MRRPCAAAPCYISLPLAGYRCLFAASLQAPLCCTPLASRHVTPVLNSARETAASWTVGAVGGHPACMSRFTAAKAAPRSHGVAHAGGIHLQARSLPECMHRGTLGAARTCASHMAVRRQRGRKLGRRQVFPAPQFPALFQLRSFRQCHQTAPNSPYAPSNSAAPPCKADRPRSGSPPGPAAAPPACARSCAAL